MCASKAENVRRCFLPRHDYGTKTCRGSGHHTVRMACPWAVRTVEPGKGSAAFILRAVGEREAQAACHSLIEAVPVADTNSQPIDCQMPHDTTPRDHKAQTQCFPVEDNKEAIQITATVGSSCLILKLVGRAVWTSKAIQTDIRGERVDKLGAPRQTAA